MHITRRTTIVTMPWLLIAATLLGCSFGPKFTAMATKAVRDTGTTFSVDAVTNTGSITVQGDEAASDTTVTARFVCGGKTDQEAQQRVHDTTLDVKKLDDGTLSVRATFPKPHMSGDRVAFDITVSTLSGAIVRTDTGSISVTNALGAIPEILSDEQIATLNRAETLAKVNEVSAARKRVTDSELDKQLHAYFKRLFLHLREFPREVRTDTGSISVTNALGAIPEILSDEQIATLSRAETLAKANEVSALDKQLHAYFNRLFAHLREIPREDGS